MSDNDHDSNSSTPLDESVSSNQATQPTRLYHYQLGAPSLIYNANRSSARWLSPYRIPSSDLPLDSARTWHDVCSRKNRIRARWEHLSLGLDEVREVPVPSDIRRGRAKNKGNKQMLEEEDTTTAPNDENTDLDFCKAQAKARLTMLLQEDFTLTDQHKDMIQMYTDYEKPYQGNIKVSFRDDKHRRRNQKELRLRPVDYAKSQEFQLQHKLQSDPAYLAPFDLEGLQEATTENQSQFFRKRVQGDGPPRSPQGNTLLACQCPCPPCSQRQQNDPSIVLIHPKGPLMERLCVSNMIPPLGRGNAGHVRPNVNEVKYLSWDVYHQYPNEIDLDDTIFEIRQSGLWNEQNPICLLTVRTGTHVSMVSIECCRPDFQDRYAFEDSTLCWGCYVLKEKHRLDLRSISRKVRSFQPVSLTSHVQYGNAIVPSKVAVAFHSMGSYDTQNVIYSCNTFYGDDVKSHRHDITNLKKVTLLDFTTNHPMCLWSAALSYVRPALAAGVTARLTRQPKAAFGLGTSLYTIDLRSNSGTFQWSPSAEEMSTEGVHSISGLITDQKRENYVWVASTSAGKTWEIDGRMPAKAVTCWSLTSGCEGFRHIVVPKHGFHGEPSLLVPTLDFTPMANIRSLGGSPFVRVYTDDGATGIHVYQRPLRQARFRAESLEAIATPGIDFTERSSIATSSYFALPDTQTDSYITGLASIRLPFQSFFGERQDLDADIYGQSRCILCNLTINNSGDIFSLNLLENTGGTSVQACHRFDDLPIGVKVINIPKNFDGRSVNLKCGRQKPTGGMNLQMFLTNQYPLAKKSLALGQEAKGAKSGVLIPAKKRTKLDDGDIAVFAPRSAPQSSVVLKSTHEDNKMLQHGEWLKLPASLTNVAASPINLYNKEENDTTRDDSFGEKRRSDLTSTAIKDTLQSWDHDSNDSEWSDEA
ncbi:hypothetical protein IV203_013493 [Nitzschia inconspicua]|uniref:Uncharacterized protein n=1 Tax=Nitzschia inconspicua TaxID=303405 RepID=A0A9K3Q825_9STRA|nr:hypothetical protein IV203_013493 [Nitzschia inconspicua]